MKVSETYQSRFLKAADLSGRTMRATIERYEVEDLGGEGKAGDTKPVLYFKDRKKGLAMNKTNALTLAARASRRSLH